MSVQVIRTLDPIYGSPILRAANNGSATWAKINTSSQWQKGTGWQASLYGGVQTGDDWGAMFFPTLEQRIPDFNSAMWSYYMTAAQTMGVNIVVWVHDPTDYSKRAEITQRGNVAGLEKTLGWNSHTLDKTTDQFMWYGEDWSGGSAAALTGSDLTSGSLYSWSDFQADTLFMGWTIYRISLEYGWEASGTFDYVWVVEAKFNGQSIPFVPSAAEIFAADTALAKVTLLTNTGVDIGDVDILSIATGTNSIGQVTANAGTNLNTSSLATSAKQLAAGHTVTLAAGTANAGVVGHNKTGIADGVITVTTPLTDVPIVGSSTPAKLVIIQAQTDNTDAIAVGGEGVVATIDTGTGIILYAGDSVTLEVDDLADVWIDAIVGGEGVRFTYLT